MEFRCPEHSCEPSVKQLKIENEAESCWILLANAANKTADFLALPSASSLPCIIRYGPVIISNLGSIEYSYPGLNVQSQLITNGFESYLWFWSYAHQHSRCLYRFNINISQEGIPLYTISSTDDLKNPIRRNSFKEAFAEFHLRLSRTYPKTLNLQNLKGLILFGLGIDKLKKRLEYLPNAILVPEYKFRHWNAKVLEERKQLLIPSDTCKRVLPFAKDPKKTKRQIHHPVDRNRKRRLVHEDNLTKMFLGSASYSAIKYRNMKLNESSSLKISPSSIAGLGLYSKRTFDPHEMVVEYAGEIVGSGVAEKREILYESRNKGCYMFRIDQDLIVDATMVGNKARFVNHSCDVRILLICSLIAMLELFLLME